ncbi:uncharacterized protein LOC142571693 isoform X1 [Dermacentor variabilis]|uniref:uncharacterized protein LOC142571693 isoform X1 n=1 Tax=Dermacentor variabilis TaxID=34621 RepID=UPI003F5C0B5F
MAPLHYWTTARTLNKNVQDCEVLAALTTCGRIPPSQEVLLQLQKALNVLFSISWALTLTMLEYKTQSSAYKRSLTAVLVTTLSTSLR